MKGFFSKSLLVSKPSISRVPKCGSCGLYKKCQSPKIEVHGKGRRKILIVGEFPSRVADASNFPFAGKAGSLLKYHLARVGIDMNLDCWLTNGVICYPGSKKLPDPKVIDYCRPNLIKTVERLNPVVVITLGHVPTKSLLSWVWGGSDIGSIYKWAGWTIPLRSKNIWVCPTFSLPWLLRDSREGLFLKSFYKHLKWAVKKSKKRPFKTPQGDFQGYVKVILDDSRAASCIRKFNTGVVSFDFETNCLKPETDGSRIYSVSFCWNGEEIIAAPWHGEVITATKEILLNKNVKKVAANMKFEDRWARNKLGVGVRNWLWDTMVCSHVINNIPGVTGLKFLSFVLLGYPVFNEHIEPFLKASGGSDLNRIDEIDLEQLLIYNGLDSLLEYKIYEVQSRLVSL